MQTLLMAAKLLTMHSTGGSQATDHADSIRGSQAIDHADYIGGSQAIDHALYWWQLGY